MLPWINGLILALLHPSHRNYSNSAVVLVVVVVVVVQHAGRCQNCEPNASSVERSADVRGQVGDLGECTTTVSFKTGRAYLRLNLII